MEHFRKAEAWLRDKLLVRNRKPFSSNLETAQEYKERWRSIYTIYFTMFLISLGFSIILTGVWPYLDKVLFCVKSVFNLILILTFSARSKRWQGIHGLHRSSQPLCPNDLFTISGMVE